LTVSGFCSFRVLSMSWSSSLSEMFLVKGCFASFLGCLYLVWPVGINVFCRSRAECGVVRALAVCQ
jgi:hypothetical protein